MTTFPTLFVSHGSPMTALEPGAPGAAWAVLARSLPRPRAVLAISAHWETELPMLTGGAAPQTIHDFGGFPEPLYRIRYPAPGAPAVAQAAQAALREAGFTAGIDGCRGLDHGAWVPLRWMYPEADVPVVQLSVQPARGTAHHLSLGAALAPLARDGILIVGSGHATHNLRDWATLGRRGTELPYVRAFADWLAGRLTANDRDALVDYRLRAPEAARAHPSEEHYLPLLVALGAAGTSPRCVRVHASVADGALAMDAYRFEPAAAAQ